MSNKAKFETGDFVECNILGDKFRAWIDGIPRPDDPYKIYKVRSYPAGFITHAKETQISLIRKKNEKK